MREKLLNILEDLCGDEIVKENPDIDLLEEDLLDSMDYTELLVEIEENFGVVIAPSEVTREEMNTPNKIIAVVSRKMQ
ncbi:MAG: D-alanine--poly(phosphoribitol) ligase subunit DltC [Lachnospiraceae bacterium]|jgi:D-alanine--poly(phosphoribitol) ligase subunit 2|uniref:D-alanine--poly(phosphoribitol) ligase subunit DltC n=1 Tax=Clostridium sp. (strain SY8519) TaxID=1042156 RepID=UPI0002171ADB|nr:D-alanine--poly(phosphoribitol) ligase subunit DltC [Clostridium sp. SY8519]MCI1655208.1 D-alanine--poly(phosphoribitol) ligase subunit DltC [Lachnospiraceae bacterium]MCI1656442.1 D-alanine--poly(phosphoribitol) ligase subunit DltC [Lachnospiraceae bacterium]MCI2194924.1 D-alanine--poly(phosphoribitol) ligase subunit DltC [Lachnospiraceae bacterium]BAK47538.1 acyl carrier protein [Clostridium sp. SY8519]HAD19931.1 D-alanine--poly(phosphoribitol) ligase subunit DltC [Lachnospiraceae bacteri